QRSVDKGNRELRPNDSREAAIKVAKPRENFIAANRVKIVLHSMCAAVRIEPCLQKQTAGRHNCKHTEHQGRRSTLGKIRDVAQILRLLPKRVDYKLPKAFKVREG